MKAALYGRVSSADGRLEVENQFVELRRFAATRSWEIVGE
jgi:predicted site-specific integrase-resolvase